MAYAPHIGPGGADGILIAAIASIKPRRGVSRVRAGCPRMRRIPPLHESDVEEKRTNVSPQIQCPSCGMRASAGDSRQYQPIRTEDGRDVRSCRNCGERFELPLQAAAAA